MATTEHPQLTAGPVVRQGLGCRLRDVPVGAAPDDDSFLGVWRGWYAKHGDGVENGSESGCFGPAAEGVPRNAVIEHAVEEHGCRGV